MDPFHSRAHKFGRAGSPTSGGPYDRRALPPKKRAGVLHVTVGSDILSVGKRNACSRIGMASVSIRKESGCWIPLFQKDTVRVKKDTETVFFGYVRPLVFPSI